MSELKTELKTETNKIAPKKEYKPTYKTSILRTREQYICPKCFEGKRTDLTNKLFCPFEEKACPMLEQFKEA